MDSILLYFTYLQNTEETELIKEQLISYCSIIDITSACSNIETYANSIILTDSSLMAEKCISYEIPYIAILHDNNKDQNFPMGAYCIQGLVDIDIDYIYRVFQRFKGIPWIITETDRLVIREITVEDVPRLYDLYKDKEVTLYMEDLFHPIEKEIEYTRSYIENVYRFYEYGIWIITLKENGTVIGRCGLEYKEGFDGLELGFMLGKEYWGMGYALEACNAVIRYSNEYLDESSIRAIVHQDNYSSRRLCEKLGFTLDSIVDSQYISYVSKR